LLPDLPGVLGALVSAGVVFQQHVLEQTSPLPCGFLNQISTSTNGTTDAQRFRWLILSGLVPPAPHSLCAAPEEFMRKFLIFVGRFPRFVISPLLKKVTPFLLRVTLCPLPAGPATCRVIVVGRGPFRMVIIRYELATFKARNPAAVQVLLSPYLEISILDIRPKTCFLSF